jgi:small-conductance mechanosensitive channel
LLFERPIQVGDAVEINGIWGEVKRINIRSTWVQTYDNASLIIPNSQFISSQVTNWSFKDKRVRSRVTVGVSYGSDVKRVKEILLDIADSMPEILKYPKPYVLFLDFGESSLIFQLRFWNNVDWFIFKETDVRFEILRRFSEEGIVIPFPQRDIHIYSEHIKTATSIPPKSKTADTPDRDSATEPQS